MIAERLSRGFHRIGLVLAVPCALGALVALIVSIGLFLLPGTVGPVFGLDDRDTEITAPDGQSFRFKEVLEEERRGTLSADRRAVLDEARRRGLVPASSRSETKEGALMSVAVAGSLFLFGLIWYGAMRTIAWVLAGFVN